MFSACSSLTSIEIPDSIEKLEHGTFSGCSSLTNIEIPASVTEIVFGVFSGCDQLTAIVERDSYAADYCEEQGLDYNYADAND